MNDFFDLPNDNFVKKQTYERKVDTNIYNPDPKSYNGSYKSVFRFLPYIFDKDKSKYTKYSAKFWNPLTKESLFVDCPSTVGKPSILWDIDYVINGLKKEEPTLYEDLKEKYSRWFSHYSPIYVKKDPQKPELEGTIKFFKFAAHVNNLIEEEINPEDNELIENVKSINPYHLLEGKDFLCVVGMKTKTWRDWTKSKFIEDITPLIFKIGDTSVTVENTEKSIKLIQEFLKKNTPKLDDYLYVEWNDETYEKVAEAIISTISNREVINRVLARTKDTKIKEMILSKLNKSTQSTSNSGTNTKSDSKLDEELDFKSENKANTPIDNTPKDKGNTGDPATSKDEYDSLFENM